MDAFQLSKREGQRFLKFRPIFFFFFFIEKMYKKKFGIAKEKKLKYVLANFQHTLSEKELIVKLLFSVLW